jgi:hypothetical protein
VVRAAQRRVVKGQTARSSLAGQPLNVLRSAGRVVCAYGRNVVCSGAIEMPSADGEGRGEAGQTVCASSGRVNVVLRSSRELAGGQGGDC